MNDGADPGHPATPPLPTDRPGALVGLRVVELASERAAWCGKLLADLGAEVVLVEPPGGHPTRRYEPFVDDVVDPERSLWWWHHHTSKLGVVVDLDDARGAATWRLLVAGADVVLEGEPPGRLAALGLDEPQLRPGLPGLVWVSVTPFGRSGPRAHEQATDLTVLAGGGPVWSCGYDDHTIPPVRGGGEQGWNTACLWAAMATLTAVLHRSRTGQGQLVDVNAHAAANVTTEAATYHWLVARETVQRQTGRHAGVRPTTATIVRGTDGRQVGTGFPPRSPREFRTVLEWLADLGAADEFPEAFFLQMGVDRGGIHLSEIVDDVEAREIFAAGRDALAFIAGRLPSYEFFVQGQRRGLAVSVVYSPEEVLADPHLVERGFPVPVHHPELGRTVTYPGAPFRLPASPWRISRPAPRLGEHQDQVLAALHGPVGP